MVSLVFMSSVYIFDNTSNIKNGFKPNDERAPSYTRILATDLSLTIEKDIFNRNIFLLALWSINKVKSMIPPAARQVTPPSGESVT